MTPVISIRIADVEDARAAWKIRNAAIRSECVGYYPPESLRIWTSGAMEEQFVSTVAGRLHVAVANDCVIGAGMIDLESGKVDAMVVRPDKMRSGVGRAILSYLEQLALEAELDQLSLDSTLNAVPFYRSCGFTGEAVAKYKSPTGILLDCVPMTKNLRHTGS